MRASGAQMPPSLGSCSATAKDLGGAQIVLRTLPPPESVASPTSNPTIRDSLFLVSLLLTLMSSLGVDRLCPGYTAFRLLNTTPRVGLTLGGTFFSTPTSLLSSSGGFFGSILLQNVHLILYIYLAWPEGPSISLDSYVTIKKKSFLLCVYLHQEAETQSDCPSTAGCI